MMLVVSAPTMPSANEARQRAPSPLGASAAAGAPVKDDEGHAAPQPDAPSFRRVSLRSTVSTAVGSKDAAEADHDEAGDGKARNYGTKGVRYAAKGNDDEEEEGATLRTSSRLISGREASSNSNIKKEEIGTAASATASRHHPVAALFTLRCHNGREALQIQRAIERCCFVHVRPPSHFSEPAMLNPLSQSNPPSQGGLGSGGEGGELILVTGPSGCGKTSLVESVVHRFATTMTSTDEDDGCGGGALLVSGKFDQLERREQYYAVVQALTELAIKLTTTNTTTNTQDSKSTSKSSEKLRRVRASLAPHKETVGIVAELVPELRTLLLDDDDDVDVDPTNDDASRDQGQPPAHSSSEAAHLATDLSNRKQVPAITATPATTSTATTPEGGTVARERLQLGLRTLLIALCSPECPIVLFLDDLQWAEPASLDVLASLYAERIPGLVVIGACRDNEVDPASYLCVILRELEAQNVVITQVLVSNTELIALRTALGEAMKVGTKDDNHKASGLARILHERTDGNMFFLTQLVRYLVSEGVLYRPNDRVPWTYDSEDRVFDAIKPASDVVSLLALVIRKQQQEIQDTLMVASCLGAEFSEVVLRAAVTFDVTEALWAAEGMQYLKRSMLDKRTWRFTHDRIQESAYSLIPIHERESIHLRIGRNLWQALSEHDIDVFAHVVVKQMRLGVRLITAPAERELLATLLLRAAELAAKMCAHVTAHEYVTLGIQLLDRRHWRDQYTLSLALYNAAAEIEYCLGSFDRMDALVAEIMENARATNDRVRAQTARIYSLGSRSALDEAIDVGLWTLKTFFGEHLPSKPCAISVMTDLWRTQRLLRRYSDDHLMAMPTMTDFQTLASIRIMCLLLWYASLCRPTLVPILAMRIVQLSLRRGLCGMSSIGFGYYGFVLAMFFNNVDAGIRYGNIALHIVDRFDAAEQLARAVTVVHFFCLSHKKPLSDLLPPLRVAHRVGLGFGDIEHSLIAAGQYGTVAIDTFTPLSDLSDDVSNFLALAKAYNHSNSDLMIRPLAQFIQCLRGQAADPSVLAGTYLEWQSALRTAKEANHVTAACIILTYKLILESLFRSTSGDAEATAAELTQPSNGFETAAPCMVKAAVWLHQGLACLAQSHRDGFWSRHRLRRAKQCHRKLVRLSRYSEANYGGKALLLGAEVLVTTGSYHRGLLQYDAAITLATTSRMWCDAGLACERLSWALQSRGRSAESLIYLNQASRLYEKWGATAKVVEIKESLRVRGASSG